MGCSAVTSRMRRMHPSKSVSMLSTCSGFAGHQPDASWVIALHRNVAPVREKTSTESLTVPAEHIAPVGLG
jgi:hypothetical protein